jgi:hypothetical protein
MHGLKIATVGGLVKRREATWSAGRRDQQHRTRCRHRTEGVLVQFAGLLVQAESSQGAGEDSGDIQCIGVIVPLDTARTIERVLAEFAPARSRRGNTTW